MASVPLLDVTAPVTLPAPFQLPPVTAKVPLIEFPAVRLMMPLPVTAALPVTVPFPLSVALLEIARPSAKLCVPPFMTSAAAAVPLPTVKTLPLAIVVALVFSVPPLKLTVLFAPLLATRPSTVMFPVPDRARLPRTPAAPTVTVAVFEALWAVKFPALMASLPAPTVPTVTAISFVQVPPLWFSVPSKVPAVPV